MVANLAYPIRGSRVIGQPCKNPGRFFGLCRASAESAGCRLSTIQNMGEFLAGVSTCSARPNVSLHIAMADLEQGVCWCVALAARTLA